MALTTILPGVFFPQLVDPDLSDETLPFNLYLVPRTISSIDASDQPNNQKQTDPFYQTISDIFNAIVSNPSDSEINDGFFPVDSFGITFQGIDDNDLDSGNLGVNLVMDLNKPIWVSEITQAIFERALISSIQQTGIKNIIIKYL